MHPRSGVHLMTSSFLVLLSCCAVSISVAQHDSPSRQATGCCEESCYSTGEQSQNTRFATKTAYDFVRDVRRDLHQVPHCEPIQFWMLSRHGTRLPTKKEIVRMPRLEQLRDQVINNYNDRTAALPDKGRLCFEDLENLSRWKWDRNITVDHEEYLVRQGEEDLRFLAKRYQTKYPRLMDSQYNPRLYEFRHTETQRTEYSFRAFAEGLFDYGAHNIHLPPPPQNDTLLKPYDFCPRWQFETELPITEYDLFKQSTLYKNLVKDVSTKLGFRFPLDEEVVGDLWTICRYDKAWKLERLSSPWCAAFTPNQVKVLEYLEDLKYYYKTGYGLEINSQIGCPPLKDMMDKFTKKVDRNEGPNVIAYFTHQAMLNLLLVTMGISKDPRPLKAADFSVNEDREWKTSKQSPFAGNLAAVLYRCEESEADRYQVLFMLNESPANIPDCRVGLCTWETVRRKYGLIADRCSLDVCHTSAATQIEMPLLTSALSTTIALLVALLPSFRLGLVS